MGDSSHSPDGNERARVRVYVPTFRRPTLLLRALKTLVSQSFSQWVAVVINDDPADREPDRIVREIGDERISVLNHEVNLGAKETFNQIYTNHVTEEFVSLLEDDNAWESDFLEQLIRVLDHRQDVDLVWCDQSIDVEVSEGELVSCDGKSVRGAGGNDQLHEGEYSFGHFFQAHGALHANGAMVLRQPAARSLKVPLSIPFTGIESFRERRLAGKMYFCSAPLARFTVTLDSARGSEGVEWARYQTGLVSSFLLHFDDRVCAYLSYLRCHKKNGLGVFICACASHPKLRKHLRHVRVVEVFRSFLTFFRRPFRTFYALGYRSASWWNELNLVTESAAKTGVNR